MAAFQVTLSELRAKTNELRELNAQFKTQTGNLETQEASLVSMWEGEARNAFDNAFKNDKTQMDNFYNLIEQYCVALDNIASKYATAEGQNVAIAQTRTY